MKKLAILFVAMVASGALWAANNVITYTASEKLSETTGYYISGLHKNAFNVAISSHTFVGGQGIITFAGEVSEIKEHAFYYCRTMTSITIPGSVTTIGRNAFYYCNSLTTLSLPSAVTSIGESAFYGLLNVEYSGIATGSPWGALNINGYFEGDLVYKDNTKTLLSGCKPTAKGSITIPQTVEKICSSAFAGCKDITSITSGSNLTEIENLSFSGCTSLSAITLGENVLSIGNEAFYGCSSLTDVPLGCRVTSIGNKAFYGSGLRSINIPASVTSLGEQVFVSCPLETITVDANSTHYKSMGGVLFNYVQDTLIYYIKTLQTATSYSIPTGVKHICNSAFLGRSNLDTVTFPTSLVSIGEYAFSGCSSLKSIDLPEYLTSIHASAFSGCDSLKTLIIPQNVTEFDKSAFSGCLGITKLVWNAKNCVIINISYGKFGENVDTILFGSEVEVVPSHLCSDMKKISSVSFGNKVTTIGENVFFNCSSIKFVSFGSGLKYIGENAFYGCSGITSLVLPEGLEYIGESAFSHCSSLASVNIPKSVTTIEYRAFCECLSLPVENNIRYADTYLLRPANLNLTSYSIKEGTKWISSDAFRSCSQLQSIFIPKTVISIGEGAFSLCDSLLSIEVDPANTHYVSKDDALLTFNLDTFLQYPLAHPREEYIFPSSVKHIGLMSFYGCKTLTSVIFPKKITKIGATAFAKCTGLTSLSIPGQVTELVGSTFMNCTGVKKITCYAVAPPTSELYECLYMIDKDIPVYVPAQSIEVYKKIHPWQEFTNFLPITAEEEALSSDQVVTEPSSNQIDITWPKNNEATSYEVSIRQELTLVCMYAFDNKGQLVSTNYLAPSRGGRANASKAEDVVTGYKYTIDGLDAGTTYTYSVVATNDLGTQVAKYDGEFTTLGTATDLPHRFTDSPIHRLNKIMKDGQVVIIQDGHRYDFTGKEVK